MSWHDRSTVKGITSSAARALCGTWSTVFGNDSFQSEAVIRGKAKGRLVPICDSCSVANAEILHYLVGTGEQRGRDGEPNRVCSLHIIK